MLVAFVFFLKSTKKVFPKLNGWLKTKKVRPKPHLSYDQVRLHLANRTFLLSHSGTVRHLLGYGGDY